MEHTPTQSGLSGPGLLDVFWRHKVLVIATTLLVGLAGWGASHLQPTMYNGQASLVLNDPRNSSVFDERRQTVLDPARYVRNRAEYMTSTGVLTRTSQVLDGRLSVDQIRARVTVEPAKELDLITINALDPTPTGAAALANAVGTAYQLEVQQASQTAAAEATEQLDIARESLQRRIDDLDESLVRAAEAEGDTSELTAGLTAQRAAASTQLFSLESQADQISVDAALYGSGVQLFERAEPPVSPAQPRPLGAALVAAFLGFLAAMALAWWRTEHRQNADDRLDPAQTLGVPLLGEIPEFSAAGTSGNLPALEASHTVAGEAYHFLVASLGFALNDQGGRTVLVTSARPGDGKTVTAANLSIAAMRDGRNVLMVDADERARGLTELTGVPAEPGLTDLADDDLPVGLATARMPLGKDDSLAVVPAGHRLSDPAGFFRTGQFRRAMTRLKQDADLVVIDSPPLLAVSDTSAIASQADGIVIVVSRGTPLRVLREVRERLEFIGTPALGYVFNRADPRRKRYGYGYGYGEYGYGQGAKEAVDGKRRGRRVREKV
jgi:Mrp family chromosome partitioning ATPase